MDIQKRIGTYKQYSIGGENYKAYIPTKLPPNPPLDISRFYELLDKATAALGRLSVLADMLPDAQLFIYMYVRKEAVLSSQIEGTQSSLSDLLLHENNKEGEYGVEDAREVSNYVDAMYYGLERIKELPLCLRLIREIHEKLMSTGRGSDKQPGEFRTSQNWIGGTRPGNAVFVPPPPEYLIETLGDLENFLQGKNIQMPLLIKAALAHVQFETIHPFLDGNGRLGRLLITFIFCLEGVLDKPMLYLSLYLKTHRQEYYNHLQAVREKGQWEEWVEFFLYGVIETAQQAVDTIKQLRSLFEQDQQKLQDANVPASVQTVYRCIQQSPIFNTSKIRTECDMPLPTVLRAVQRLEELDIIDEITGKQRHKVYVYTSFMEILDKGTEPIET